MDRLIEMKPRNGAGGSLPDPVLQGNEHRRAVELLRQTGRDDPDDPRVPARGPEHQHLRRLLAIQSERLPARLLKHDLLDRLTFPVQLVEPAGQAVRHLRIPRGQKADRFRSLRDPSGRVDPGSDLEVHLSHADALSLDPRRGFQRRNARSLPGAQEFQSLPDQETVFSHERHHVGNRPQRDEIEQSRDRIDS
jgi:hypothetical protein